MNPITGVSSVSSGASSVLQQTLASLQAQMARYSPAANSGNSQASIDYRALQTAIKSGNVSEAQAALARLQRDTKAASSSGSAAASSPASSPVDSDGDRDGSSSAVQSSPENSLDTTA